MWIGNPYVETRGDRVFLCAPIEICGVRQTAWFSVEPEYAEYLTDDRADAFVVGLLTTAMRLGENIVCDAPVTRRLKYQLNHYLIPAMTTNKDWCHPMQLCAPTTQEPLPCAAAVGTGWTGGVDCTYTLMTHIEARQPDYRLTHLLITSNGALEGDDTFGQLRFMVEKTRRGIAKEFGLSVVGVDSNLHVLQDELYMEVASFRLPAVALALQKLFKVFLNSSGYCFSKFSVEKDNSDAYELMVLPNFETDATAFYSAGGPVSRIEKIRELAEFQPAQKHLHPCIYVDRNNCGYCGKCRRTMLALYAMDHLDAFQSVFDVDAFYRDRDEHLRNALLHTESEGFRECLREMQRTGKTIPPEILRQVRIRRAATKLVQRDKKIQEGILR